jgi:RHS repeat-associated protein
MNHPDRGDLFYRYDDASNLTYLQTTNLATDNAFIHYGYQYNRLESIKYPEVVSGFENLSNVNYTFGAPSSGNETGRLICQEDASGRQEFKYGNMGEVISNKRTIIAPTPNLPNRTYVTEFNYDSWNRLQGMVYPDGEKVFYFYDLGGNLNGVEGDHRYVERVDYDHYEQRRYIKYGNGTETIYDYSPELRRLEQLQVLTSNSEHLLKNSYAYDFVGNVTKIENSATYHSVNHMGGKYEHNYGYDNLNRLIGAKGGFSGHASQQELGNDFESEYKLKMDYNSTHGIVNKSQDHSKNAIQFLPNTYTNDYTYFEGTHKLKQIDNPNNGDFESFNYDQNGNIISRVNQNNNQKYYFWDESDRLRVAVERLRLHHYIYDAGGQRVLKASSSMEDLYENGQLVNSTVQMGNYTSYPSAFLVVDPDGVYSKHYYAGAQRIAARVGVESADVLFPEDQANFCSQEGGRTAEEHKKLQQNDLQHYLDKGEIKTKLSFKEYQPKVEKEEEETTASSDKGESYQARAEDQIYYYHPDHLGTATFLTDGNGLPYEFFLNLPFGETMAEQHSQTADYDNRWKFTGHELDRETGLYYAGARYFDPKISIWLSVDPLAEKYPNWNPYNYVMQNPINLIDPTGMCPEEGDPQKKQNVNVVVLPKNIPKTDVAINNIKYSAENDLDENVLVLYVTGIKDLGKQLKENNVESIGTLSNHAHGNYNENSLKVGDDNLNTTNDFKKLGETLKPFCTENTNIILQSCHAGSGKDLTKSEANMKALGDASGANVYAPMTWGRGSISLFNNGKGAVSTIPHKYRDVWWKEGHPLNRINSTFMDQYKRYNPNPRCWEDKFSTIKGGRFQTNGTLKF